MIESGVTPKMEGRSNVERHPVGCGVDVVNVGIVVANFIVIVGFLDVVVVVVGFVVFIVVVDVVVFADVHKEKLISPQLELTCNQQSCRQTHWPSLRNGGKV